METRPLGATKFMVPFIGQGTWRMEAGDIEASIRSLQRGIDCGMIHIDTAEMYGAGEVEERVVSRAISGRRDQVFLASKVLPQNASRQGTLDACEQSLRRLKTDRLDLYLLHWTGTHPLEDTFAAFEQLIQEGKILSFGVSNFDVVDLEEAYQIAGAGKIVCNQVLYHIRERAIEHEVLPWCKKHDVALVAYSPFGAGRFLAKNSPGFGVLEEIAALHNATPYQVILRFLARDTSVFVIPKSSSEQHTIENAKADAITLSKEEIERLKAAFPLGERANGIPTI